MPATPPSPNPADWLARRAADVRAGKLSRADADALAEYLDSIRRAGTWHDPEPPPGDPADGWPDAPEGRLGRLWAAHLCRWAGQSVSKDAAWQEAVEATRDQLKGDSVPAGSAVTAAFAEARRRVLAETTLDGSALPPECPVPFDVLLTLSVRDADNASTSSPGSTASG